MTNPSLITKALHTEEMLLAKLPRGGKEFTFVDAARMTGTKLATVQSCFPRMKRDGLLTSQGVCGVAVYRVSEDYA